MDIISSKFLIKLEEDPRILSEFSIYFTHFFPLFFFSYLSSYSGPENEMTKMSCKKLLNMFVSLFVDFIS